jgi:putative ABC transport system ATP-binding protein
MTQPLIAALGVHVSFGSTPALRGASVSVTSGELLAIMGPSGSGKSTLLQFGQLISELTATDNIAMPLLLGGARHRTAYRRAQSWLSRMELADLGRRRTGELSGGQAQRVAIARALVARPRVLFADEPTGSLDTLAGEHVMGVLVDTAREEGVTVVLVTHDARIAAYADREVMVRDGLVIDRTATEVEVAR